MKRKKKLPKLPRDKATRDQLCVVIEHFQDELSTIGEGVTGLQRVLAEHSKQFEKIEHRFTGVDNRFVGVDKQFYSIDRRFESIDHRFDTLEKTANKHTLQLISIESKLDHNISRTEFESRVGALERKMAA